MSYPDSNEALELKDGIWYAKKKSEISYPEGSNDQFFIIEPTSFWFRHRNKVLLEALKHWPANGLFHDIGGGNGFVSYQLQENEVPTVLIEPGPKGVANAKKRGVKKVVCSTFENAGLKEKSVAAVGLFDVVEHIEDDEAFLGKVRSYLADNGRVYITVPAYNILWSEEDSQVGHYRRYTTKKIKALLQKVGFEVEYSTYLFAFLPLPIFFTRSIFTKLGLKWKYNDQSKLEKEHANNSSSFSAGIINALCNFELNRIKKKKSIFTGSSCFMVARKVNIK